ncbi:hypothetical protein I3760_03G222400 [Carya illinoinensis]|uniref:OVATE domain-containing protein n=1 Tax=Carya illinoinensis TaxID=32201 RepID=A0A8T1R572_CARIL|nr:hypothetical protein I3760_03G222400 [Carya illinoinensis]KAG6662278.1 hypothetical protein CIPAW_03G231900 [Carya illinoinensis]
MLLRNSISNTKKFFRKTLQSFKSLFSEGYQKLPKTPPLNPFSFRASADMNVQPSYKDLGKFYTDQWESSDKDMKIMAKNGIIQKKSTMASSTQQEKEVYGGSFLKFSQATPVKKNHVEIRRSEEYDHHHNHHEDVQIKSIPYQRRRQENSCSKGMMMREGGIRTRLVAQKLKEMESLDMGNIDHLLDIEEVLHYYSRLTCPAYLDIVDKFFMDIYEEFFGAATIALTPARSINSRLRQRRSVMRS